MYKNYFDQFCNFFFKYLAFYVVCRYVEQGKSILQPHHLIDELENIIGDDDAKKSLSDGPFSEVLKSAQVIFCLIYPLLFCLICPEYWNKLCKLFVTLGPKYLIFCQINLGFGFKKAL